MTERQDQKGSREFTVPDTTLVIRFIRDALVAMKSSKATFDIENMRMKKTFTDLEGKTLKSIGVKNGDVLRIIGRKPRKDEVTGDLVIDNCFQQVSSAPKHVKECRKELEDMMCELSDIEMTKEHLGRGGFGAVWVGVMKKTKQKVAVKEIMSECMNMSDEERAGHEKYYWREVLMMATMKHPALMNIIGYTPFTHTDTNRPALLMPVMTCSCQHMIDQEKIGMAGDWDLSQKHIVVYGIAAGMAFLHKNRITHRDLKPQNVLLDENRYPYITDFGLAKFVREGQTRQQSIVAGTALYMAPEQLLKGEGSPKVDVYAYALTMFAILTGNDPFPVKSTPAQCVLRMTRGMRPSLATVPEQYHDLLRACWSDNPEERPDFKHILKELGEEKYLCEVDVDRFKEYQAKVAPEPLVPVTSKKVVIESIQRRSGLAPPPSSTYVLQSSAEKGDVDAMYRIAVRLRTGDGVQKDEKKAFQWFEKAYNAGYRAAAFDLAMCYKKEIGTERNISKALELLQIGVKDEDVHAIYELGMCHFYGHGVPRNEIEGAKLFKQGSDEKFQFGDCENMYGYCLETGKGCKTDKQKALEFYRLASDHGSPEGMYNYADMFHHGLNVPKDIVEACHLYWLAGKAGHLDAFYSLTEIYHNGEGPVKMNKDLCVRAASQGMQQKNFRCTIAYCDLIEEGWTTEDSKGQCLELRQFAEGPEFSAEQNNFACELDSGKGCRQDVPKAQKYWRMAGNSGSGMAWSNLAHSLYSEDKVDEAIECWTKSVKLGCATGAIALAKVMVLRKEYTKAFALAEATATRGHINAYLVLGSLYMKGQGCTKDLAKGFSWYKKAADGDHPVGLYKAGCCYLKGKGTSKDVNKGRALLERAKVEAEEPLARKAAQKLAK